jgi:hypothetical protein
MKQLLKVAVDAQNAVGARGASVRGWAVGTSVVDTITAGSFGAGARLWFQRD